jgi:hypothetical protein
VPLGDYAGANPRAVIGPNHVYVLTGGSGSYTLSRIAKDGSGVQTVDTVSADAGGFAADSSFVYVARATDGIERYDALTGQADASWGAVTPVFASHLTVHGSAFFWVGNNCSAYTAPKATGVPQLPLSPAPSGGQSSQGVVATSTGVYISSGASQAFAVPITGGSAEPLTLPSGGGIRLAADGAAAYMTVTNQGIYRHVFDPAKAQQDAPALIHPQAITFTGLVSDGTYVIYTRYLNTSVHAVPVGGGNASVLGTLTGLAGLFGMDSSFVYLYAGTTVYKLAK